MTVTVERMLPLYEAKMLDAYDHRDADVFKSATAEKRQNQPRYLTDREKQDPRREPMPIAWIREDIIPGDIPGWLVGFSDVTSATNERTVLSAALPRAGVANSYPLISGSGRGVLLSILNSFVFDYLARLKVAGLHLNFFYMKQLPILPLGTVNGLCPWHGSSVGDWIIERVARLSCTSWSIALMAEELTGKALVFPWDPEKRFLTRCEIDAAMFHLYGVERDDMDHIMGTFGIVQRKDQATHGEYRTKRVILEVYDALQRAIDTGVPYEPIVDLHPLEPAPDESSRP